MNRLLVSGITAALAGGFALTAFAQARPAQTEIDTAHAHALMAQNANTLAMAHTHLHHVVNCLVGPNGHGFDATAGDPCKNQGKGALIDSATDHTLHARLESVLADAQAGLRSESLATVQQDAGKAAASLQGSAAAQASGASM